MRLISMTSLALFFSIFLPSSSTQAQDDDLRIAVGEFKVEERGVFRRLIHNDVLWATQISQKYLVKADSPIPFGC
jgi:hypothetical protein